MTTAKTPISSPALDKRRTKWLEAGAQVTAAEQTLATLDQQIEANAAQRDAAKAERKAANKRSGELKKEAKSLAKQRDGLRSDRGRAKRELKKSRARAKTVEAKFDKALLKDMLRQAKSAELAAHRGEPESRNGTPRRRATSAGRKPGVKVAPSPRRTAATNARSA